MRQGDEDDGKPTRQFILLSRTPDPKHHRVSMSEVDQHKSVHAGTQITRTEGRCNLRESGGKARRKHVLPSRTPDPENASTCIARTEG